MLKIRQSNRFKKDYTRYCKDIDSMLNENVKKECYSILNKLVEQFRIIDSTHDVTNKSVDPTKIRENVELSISLRQKLDKLIKDSKDL